MIIGKIAPSMYVIIFLPVMLGLWVSAHAPKGSQLVAKMFSEEEKERLEVVLEMNGCKVSRYSY